MVDPHFVALKMKMTAANHPGLKGVGADTVLPGHWDDAESEQKYERTIEEAEHFSEDLNQREESGQEISGCNFGSNVRAALPSHRLPVPLLTFGFCWCP